MKASALMREAVKNHLMTPKQFADWRVDNIPADYRSQGLCAALWDCVEFFDGGHPVWGARLRLTEHMREAIGESTWFHNWLRGQVPNLDLYDYDTCVAVQKHRIEWAERIAQQFERAGD